MPRSPRSSHGTNLCIDIGTLARCRRAEGTLHASESSLHRAGNPLHVQRMRATLATKLQLWHAAALT